MQRTLGTALTLAAGCGALRMMDSVEDLDASDVGVTSKWSLSPSLEGKGHAALCDKALVAEGCHVLDLGHTADTKTSVKEIMMTLSATHMSTKEFLAEIGIKAGSDKAEEIDCLELCEKTKTSIGEQYLPPVSDVACRPGDGGAVCDIDLSPAALEAIKFPENSPDFHAGRPVMHNKAPNYKSGEKGSLSQISSVDDTLDEVSPKDAKIRIANLFRMYPLLDIEVGAEADEENEDEHGAEEATALLEAAEALSVAANSTQGCRKTCSSKAHCQYKHACGDCSFCNGNGFADDGNAQAVVAGWQAEVEVISRKAQGYVAQAIRKTRTDSTNMQRWFGGDSDLVRARVLRVLNSLTRMLSNVAYLKGKKCESNTYAYVYPEGRLAKNKKDQFVFYLCSVYFKSDEGEKIETLTHEGSHHSTAFTDDVCSEEYDDKGKCITAYGRDTCKRVARDYPDLAQDNADNYCYYINDINNHKR